VPEEVVLEVVEVEEDILLEEVEEAVKGHPHLLEFFLKWLLDMVLCSTQFPFTLYPKTI